MRRCRTRARARILWSVLAFFMSSLCSAQVDVVVNIAGADAVASDQVLARPRVLDVSSMDNSDLFVAMCLPGTFSPDNEGICHDCVKCVANQYEKLACIPTRDRTCANCTVCGSNDIELCQCSVKTSQCVTGDRVCLKVPPTVVNLVVDFTSNGVLSNKQQAFVRSGLAVGYTDWLAMQFDVDPNTVELTDFVKTGALTYKAYFRFNEVYGQAKVARIQGQTKDFFQGGIYYTFGGGGRRRRLLQTGAGVGTGYLSAQGVYSDCTVDKNCTEPFTEFQFLENSTCAGVCGAVPCPVGFSGGPKNCQPCPEGTYKAAVGFGDCTECPAGFTSPTAANSSEACTPLFASPTEPASSEPTSAAETTTAGQSTPSPTQPFSSLSATSPPPSSSPSALTSSSSAALPPSSSSSTATSTLSTAQPTASQAGSSASSAPSAASSTTGQAPPQTTQAPAPPPPGWTGTTTGTTTGTGTGSPSSGSPSGGGGGGGSSGGGGYGGGSVVNTNANTNSNSASVQMAPISVQMAPISVSVNVPAPAPIAAPPSQAASPSPALQPLRPVFNNYVTIQQPQPRPAQPQPMPDYHRHYRYDGDDGVLFAEDSWAFFVLFFALLALTSAALCFYSPCCPCSAGCCSWEAYDDRPQRRPVVRFRLVPGGESV